MSHIFHVLAMMVNPIRKRVARVQVPSIRFEIELGAIEGMSLGLVLG
jgi:hypothetical protein